MGKCVYHKDISRHLGVVKLYLNVLLITPHNLSHEPLLDPLATAYGFTRTNFIQKKRKLKSRHI